MEEGATHGAPKQESSCSESRRRHVSEKPRGGRIGGWGTISRVLEVGRVPTSSRFIDQGMGFGLYPESNGGEGPSGSGYSVSNSVVSLSEEGR